MRRRSAVGETPRSVGKHRPVSCDTKEVKTKVKKGFNTVKQGDGELLTGGNGGDGAGFESERKKKGKQLQKARNVTRKTMVGLYTREGEGIGRNLKKMAGGHGFEWRRFPRILSSYGEGKPSGKRE